MAEAAAEKAHPEDALDGKPMTFWEHLEELRRRLIWSLIGFFACTILAWEFHERILAILVAPYAAAWRANNLPGNPSLHFGAPAAAFVAYFKLAAIGGAALAAPLIFYQLWAFVAPGLYAREKRYVVPFVALSTVLFVGGGYFGWRAAFPVSFRFLLGLSGVVGDVGVTVTPTVMMGEYIEFCSQILLGFGVIFEIPMLLLFLSIAGIVHYLMLIEYARWFILVAFGIAAVLAPPDWLSLLVMAIPMCVLYVVAIGLVWAFGKPPTPEQRAAFLKWRKKRRRPQPVG